MVLLELSEGRRHVHGGVGLAFVPSGISEDRSLVGLLSGLAVACPTDAFVSRIPYICRSEAKPRQVFQVTTFDAI